MKDTVVLVHDADGKVGKITVTTKGGCTDTYRCKYNGIGYRI